MGSRNGYIKKARELGPQFSPQDVETLRRGRAEVLLGLAESDKERALLEAALERWEERPETTRLLNKIALRVQHPEDRYVLTRAEGFRILLPDPMPEPPVDPQLEQLILDQAAKRAASEAAFEAVQRRIERTLVDAQDVVGDLLDVLRDAPPVLRPESQRLENQQVERALENVEFRHRVPYRPVCAGSRLFVQS